MGRFDTSFSGDMSERVVQVKRVSKVVKGGRRFSFSATVVVGDGNGSVGLGQGKANEVPEAIRKGGERARKNLTRIALDGRTIPHEVNVHFGAAHVMLKPAAPGTGVIAGGAVRAVVEAAGIHDILSKSLGSNNPSNVVKAAMNALIALRTPEEISRMRGRDIRLSGRGVRENRESDADMTGMVSDLAVGNE